LLGAILRLDIETDEGYNIPEDNPFTDGGGRGEIWVYGLRNAWRFSFDGEDLWIADVGQNRVEEVNHLTREEQPGANLGWNAYEGDRVYDQGVRDALDEDPVMPVATYSIIGDDCAVTGGHVYRGQMASLRGLYLFGDFCSGTIWALGADASQETGWRMGKLYDTSFRISSFGVDEKDDLYIVDHRGNVYAIGPR
jgi:glucose/arabinose dehydrogenase